MNVPIQVLRILASLGTPFSQVGCVGSDEFARSRRWGSWMAFWKALGGQIFVDRCSCQMCLFGNLGNRESLSVIQEHFLVTSEALFTCGIGEGLFVDRARLFALLEGGRWLLETLFEAGVQPTDNSFKSLTPIFDHVPPIHDLPGFGSPKVCSTSIFPLRDLG
jgi:hypothetical protein